MLMDERGGSRPISNDINNIIILLLNELQPYQNKKNEVKLKRNM